MNIVTVSAILAGFAIGSCSASAQIEAREIVVADLVFSGYSKTGTPYPSYNISVPEDGVTVAISRFLKLLGRLQCRIGIETTDKLYQQQIP